MDLAESVDAMNEGNGNRKRGGVVKRLHEELEAGSEGDPEV